MRMNRSFARMRPLLLMALVLTFVLAAQVAPTYAAAIVVNTITDELAAPGTGCSLREAIFNANNNNNVTYPECVAGTVGTDTISFIVPGIGTHTLTLGQLVVLDTPLTVQAATGNTVFISGNNTSRVWLVGNDAALDTLPRSLTLINIGVRTGNGSGNVGGAGVAAAGGCIYVATNSSVTLDGSVVRNCTATGAGQGGGIFASSGSSGSAGTNVILTNSATVRNNSAGQGGGIYMTTGEIQVINSACIRNNSASVAGGGIYAAKDSHVQVGTPGLGYIESNSCTATQGGGIFLDQPNAFSGDGARFYNNTVNTFDPAAPGIGAAWYSQGGDDGVHPNGLGRFCINCCIVNNRTNNFSGDPTNYSRYAVYQDVNVLDTTWTGNWWGHAWGPLISDLDPAQTNASIGSSVSNGDGIRGTGLLAVNVGLTNDGTFSTAPTGGWLTTPIADCSAATCTAPSSLGAARTCTTPPACGLIW